MSRFISLVTIFFVAVSVFSTSNAQSVMLDSVSSLGNGSNNTWLPWNGGTMIEDISEVDNNYVFIETVGNNKFSDTLFFSGLSITNDFEFVSSISLNIVRKVPEGVDKIKDHYLVLTYKGQNFSRNVADSTDLWSISKDTITYTLTSDLFLNEITPEMLNEASIGFKYVVRKTTTSSFQSWIDYLSISVKGDNLTDIGNKNEKDTGIVVYPNPFDDYVKLKNSYNTEVLSLIVYDLNGNFLGKEENVKEGKLELDESVILEVETSSGIERKLLIKQ